MLLTINYFWKTVKLFFSDKGNYGANIKLVEEEVLQNDTKSPKSIVKFESHPSIYLIKNKIKNGNNLKFEPVSLSDIKLEIRLLNPQKATTHKNIPPKILKLSSEATVLHRLFNETITKGVFLDNLKLVDVTPVFKKDDPFNKKNYRPVSVLPTISKICEKLMQRQINNYIINHLSSYLCGYRKGYNTQQALVSLIEKWKKILDDKGFGGAVLMDLSKAFDTLNHKLLIAKLHVYGFNRVLVVGQN